MVNYDPHNKQRLTAAEIALLDSQLPDIGGAVRSEPVTPDGDGWRVRQLHEDLEERPMVRLQGHARRLRRRLLDRALPRLHAR